MNYEPTNWKTGDLISSTRLNHIEQGIASLYPEEIVIAPEQTVTITDVDLSGANITLVDNFVIPKMVPPNWTVTVNGNLLVFTLDDEGSNTYKTVVDGVTFIVYSNGDFVLLQARGGPDMPIVSGDYIVKITSLGQSTTTLPDASYLEDGDYSLRVENGKWVVSKQEQPM